MIPVGGTSAILMVLFSLDDDGMREVLADLLRVDVERRDELNVADVILAELDVHQPWHTLCWICVLVVLDALDQ